MLRISKLTDHAARLMLALSETHASKASATHLATQTRIEPATVSKLLKLLAKAGLVASSRGVSGGYTLAKAPKDISIADVVIAIEGPIAMTDCSHGPGQCESESFCGTSRNWKLISAAVETALRNVSLADMLPRPSKRLPTPIHVMLEGEA